MAMDLAHVDDVVQPPLLEQVDHRPPEAVPELAGIVTTGESLARAFWDVLRRRSARRAWPA